MLACESHRGDDVVGAGASGDERGPAVDCAVPHPSGLVVSLFGGSQERTPELGAQAGQELRVDGGHHASTDCRTRARWSGSKNSGGDIVPALTLTKASIAGPSRRAATDAARVAGDQFLVNGRVENGS